MLTKRIKKKLDGNCAKNAMGYTQHILEAAPYKIIADRYFPPISKTIQVRQTRHMQHCCSFSDSGGVTVSKLDLQTYTSEYESHWAPHSFGLVPHRSKELCKLLLIPSYRQPWYYVYIWLNTLGEGMSPFILPCYVLNSYTSIFIERWIWHSITTNVDMPLNKVTMANKQRNSRS